MGRKTKLGNQQQFAKQYAMFLQRDTEDFNDEGNQAVEEVASEKRQ